MQHIAYKVEKDMIIVELCDNRTFSVIIYNWYII